MLVRSLGNAANRGRICVEESKDFGVTFHVRTGRGRWRDVFSGRMTRPMRSDLKEQHCNMGKEKKRPHYAKVSAMVPYVDYVPE
jgi:hypothetical protein